MQCYELEHHDAADDAGKFFWSNKFQQTECTIAGLRAAQNLAYNPRRRRRRRSKTKGEQREGQRSIQPPANEMVDQGNLDPGIAPQGARAVDLLRSVLEDGMEVAKSFRHRMLRFVDVRPRVPKLPTRALRYLFRCMKMGQCTSRSRQ